MGCHSVGESVLTNITCHFLKDIELRTLDAADPLCSVLYSPNHAENRKF